MKLQYCKSFKINLQLIPIINRDSKPIEKQQQQNNDYNAMITMVSQISSVWFDNKLLHYSLHNEISFNQSGPQPDLQCDWSRPQPKHWFDRERTKFDRNVAAKSAMAGMFLEEK